MVFDKKDLLLVYGEYKLLNEDCLLFCIPMGAALADNEGDMGTGGDPTW